MKILYLLLFFSLCTTALKSQNLTAGASEVDITPPLGTIMNGGFESDYATSVHDPLHAKAIVLKNSNTTIAIVVVDICLMRKDLIDDTKRIITARTGIFSHNIMISSTHTHSGGSVESTLLSPADLPYRRKLPSLILQAVSNAQKELQPAELCKGKISIPEHVRVRRYIMGNGYTFINPVDGSVDKVKTNPSGATKEQIIRPTAQPDTELSYVGIRNRSTKRWISIIGNYSMHYVGDRNSGTLTSDYFGAFSRNLKAELNCDSNFVGVLSNGTSGDANIEVYVGENTYPKEKYKKSELIAMDLAKAVAKSIMEAKFSSGDELKPAYREMKIGVRKPSANELEKAKKVVAGLNFKKIGGENEAEFLRKIYSFEQVMLAEYPDSLSLPVQAIRIGDIIIGALPGEIFSETGLWLKKNVKQYYFTIGLGNAYVGYIPPEHEFKLGGYETWRCRTSCLEEKAEEKLRLELKALAESTSK